MEGTISTVDSLKLLVVRVSFSDRDFSTDPVEHDSLYFANALRQLDEYFLGASLNKFHTVWELAVGVVELDRREGYYGEDGWWEERVAEMLMEVVAATDSAIDYSGYDAFALIHAGSGQETDFNGDSPEQLWSGFVDPAEMEEILSDTLGTPGIPTNDTMDGDTFYIDNLMVWPEDSSQDDLTFGSLGVYAYQVGLRLGMIPLFDTTPSGFPDSQGIGSFGLMGYGLYNAAGFIPAFPCAFHRYLVGWAEALEVWDGLTVNIRDINSGSPADTALVKIPISSTEYFLVANRVHDKDFDGRFDFIDLNGNGIPENEDTLLGAEFDFFLTATSNPVEYVEDPEGGIVKKVITGSGLMVWHIDEKVIIRSLESGKRPNDDPRLKGVDLEEADGIQDLDRPGGGYAFGSYLDSFREGNKASFGPGTDPSSSGNCGVRSGVELADISGAAPVMNFTIRFSLPLERKRVEFSGMIGGLSPIPADVGGVNGEELIVAADTGLIYLVPEAGDADWDGRMELLAEIPGAVWTSPPVLADIDGDTFLEIFIASGECSLYAFDESGSPFPFDDDSSPGSITITGPTASAPMALEADGDTLPEVLVLSSGGDATWAYVVGYSIDPAGSEYIPVADDVVAIRLSDGRLSSHTARGSVKTPMGSTHEGIFFSTIGGDGRFNVRFVAFMIDSEPVAALEPVSGVVPGGFSPGYLLTPAAGDVDRDGSEEMVLAVPGAGLVYFEPRKMNICGLRGERMSPPALADIDGDGILETALRDEGNLYLLTGFGAPLNGWPVVLSDRIVEIEQTSLPPPPVVRDLDADGELEVVFGAGGDLYAYDAAGTPVGGWPLPGDGGGSGSPALLEGTGNETYIFYAGFYEHIQGVEVDGMRLGPAHSSMTRYALGGDFSRQGGWPFYRFDMGGSGRQLLPDPTNQAGEFVDEGSFICYPNPARGDFFTVRVIISAPAEVIVRILNLEGERVVELKRTHSWIEGSRVPFEEEIPTGEMSSGIYICSLDAAGSGWNWRGVHKFAVVR